MKLDIGKHKVSVIEKGVYYFAPASYPGLSDLELKNLLAFISYEKTHGRQTEVVCENDEILKKLDNALKNPDALNATPLPKKIGGCNVCLHQGCLTEFVYHATDIQSTIEILSSGRLLSAARVSGKTGAELAHEKQDSLWNDPADFFEYIMFCWGNCVVGEYVVMSERNDRFIPGIRFYFRYNDLLRHPGHAFDGYHCIKVKNEILLSDYLHSCVVPECYKSELKRIAPPDLSAKLRYISWKGIDPVEWTKCVYDYVVGLAL